MPGLPGARVHDHERFRPAGPELSQQHPGQSIGRAQTRARPFPLEHRHLLAKREHFKGDVAATAEEGARGDKECEDE